MCCGRAGSAVIPDSVSVINGLPATITIILKQILPALSRDNDDKSEFGFAQLTDGETTVSELCRALVTARPGAIIGPALLAFLMAREQSAGPRLKPCFQGGQATLWQKNRI